MHSGSVNCGEMAWMDRADRNKIPDLVDVAKEDLVCPSQVSYELLAMNCM